MKYNRTNDSDRLVYAVDGSNVSYSLVAAIMMAKILNRFQNRLPI